MIYDLSLSLGWLPKDVRELTLSDLDGLGRAARRRDARSKRGKR
jgi:hypothetical protein